jgi:hypothetical protein
MAYLILTADGDFIEEKSDITLKEFKEKYD